MQARCIPYPAPLLAHEEATRKPHLYPAVVIVLLRTDDDQCVAQELTKEGE